jgi:hypothetical protein
MLLDLFRKVVVYTKEIQEITLFNIMADSESFVVFAGTPLYFILLPLIGLLVTIMALINGYHLSKADNKNFDKWSGFIVSALCAVLANISLYGSVIATALGVTFAAGSWFFLSSVAVAFTHQALMFGLNIYRAYESSRGSVQRMHYVQAALNNLFLLGLTTAVIGAVVFVMLTPIAPAIGSAFATTAFVLTAANMLWRMIPHNGKQFIKKMLQLGKPDVGQEDTVNPSGDLEHAVPVIAKVTHGKIFSQFDYSGAIKNKDLKTGTDYLRTLIENKIAVYEQNPVASDKNNQKKALLKLLLSSLQFIEQTGLFTSSQDLDRSASLPETCLSDKVSEPRKQVVGHSHIRSQRTLEGAGVISRKQLLQRYPLAFQSFWAEKGEVEQIYNAVLVLRDKYKKSMENSLDLSVSDPLRASI